MERLRQTVLKRVLAERKRHDEEVEQTLGDETGTFAAAGR